MSEEFQWKNKKVAGFLAIFGMVLGLAMATLLWIAPEGGPALAQVGERAQEGQRNLSSSLLASNLLTTTVYLPIAVSNFSLPPPIFGVQFRETIDSNGGLNEAVAGNMRWVRFSTFDWDLIEPARTEPPTYDWSVVDTQSLLNASANQMEIIAVVRFAPEWAQALPGIPCGPIKQDTLDEYAQFLTQLVQRYSVPPYNIHYWELFNEPEIQPSLVAPWSGFGCWGDVNDPYFGGGYYAEMLKSAYPAIKAEDPSAQVLVGGLLLDCNPDNPPPGKDCTSSRFMEGILRNGGGPYFDIVSYHAYTYFFEDSGLIYNPNWAGSVTAVPEKTAFLRDVLAAYGSGDKPMMNTEAALLCFDPTSACREQQARYIPQAYAEAISLHLDAQIYFAMINDTWRYTGLLSPTLQPRPAYYAYQAATGFLAAVSYLGPVSGYPSGIEGYSFIETGGPWHVDVIWAADGLPWSVTLPAGASAYDHYGNLLATGGAIQVDDAPIYVKRP